MTQSFNKIKEAAEGLFYISETDAPFHMVRLEATKALPEALLKLTGKPKETLVTCTILEAFMRSMLALPPNATIQQLQTVKRFQVLQQALQEVLTDIKVYKIGNVEITVFIIGKLLDGSYAGLCTEIVET